MNDNFSSNWASSCQTAETWHYANWTCEQKACTNKAETHSYYTSNATSDNCDRKCEDGYKRVWDICQPITYTISFFESWQIKDIICTYWEICHLPGKT